MKAAGFRQFTREQERAFRAEYVDDGRYTKSELWLLLLFLGVAFLVFETVFFGDRGTGGAIMAIILVAVAVPAIMRWLSSAFSPFQRWSAALYIGSVYIDVAGWGRCGTVRPWID